MTTVDPTSSQSTNTALQNYINQQAQLAAASSSSSTSNSQTANGATTLQGISGNFNTFIKILTTQLQHQDPTNATDTNQFTQELVQFAGVEQQLNTNSDLQTLINLQKTSSGVTATLGYIGKYVEAPTTNQLPLQNGQAELAYTLPTGVSNVSISVMDATGKTVANLTGLNAAGLDRVAWDGKDANGNQLTDGTYTFSLKATGANGSVVNVTDTRVVGLVTAVQTNTDGTTSVQITNGMTVKTTAIDAVYDPTSLPQAALGDGTSDSSSNANPNNTSS